MQYYRVLDPDDLVERWSLTGMWDATGIRLDPRVFRYGNRLATDGETVAALTDSGQPVTARLPLRIGVRTAGPPLDFTLGPFDVPVVTPEVAAALAGTAGQDVQLFPARVDGHHGEYAVVNAAALLDAIDFERSGVEWPAGQDGRPDKTGGPRTIYPLVVDPAKAEGRHLFRLVHRKVALIASEAVVDAIENVAATGIAFKPA